MELFPEIHKKFGFGCMRLPMIGDEVDIEQFKKMTDRFIEEGFNYFDTAHGYINGKSELAIKEALTSRYPRDKYLLTNKLTESFFESEEDIRPFFQTQLEACGVEYFDFYLMHAQKAANFGKYKACRAYETAFELKKEGKVRHVGLSFHDKAEVLDEILTTYPEIEIVQIQFNYLDYDSESVESKKVYDVCVKHNKPVLVMEPVKGGNLVNLPADAQVMIDALHQNMSNASYAIRFAAGFDNMRVILSGMSDLAQMEDNISFMKDFQPLSEEEQSALRKVVAVFHEKQLIPCTACRYCVEENHCPMNIRIPDIFRAYNDHVAFADWNAGMYYRNVTDHSGKASDCIKCGMCESVCPQHLTIRDYLETCAATFE
ncbi:MAG: aldo/keto reductase [Lachnospiraceae bacterium]|nr:aldo/keto reductase [Lachnospiraceae bacterium]